MRSRLRHLLRIPLCLWGILMIGTGMALLVAPDTSRSEDPPPSLWFGFVQGWAVVGYGLLLVMPPRVLARRTWICALLVISVLVVEWMIWLDDHQGHSLRFVSLRILPVAVALALVAQARRDLSACDECGSRYSRSSSPMAALCPECAHVLYGYPNCRHEFVGEKCRKCGWDGSVSAFVRSGRRRSEESPESPSR